MAEQTVPEFKTWRQVFKERPEGVVGIYGHRRKGKTGTAFWLAEEAHKAGRKVAIYMFPKKASKLLPAWIKRVYSIEELRRLKGYLVIADELALRANAREFQTESNKELYKLMALAGQCHQLLYLICQHSRQLDVGLAMEPDLIIFKQPSLLHIRFARPELRPEIQQAYTAFLEAKGDKRGWAYAVDFHQGRRGFLKTRLPGFWSQELSEAYARYELEQVIEEQKGVKSEKARGHGRARQDRRA